MCEINSKLLRQRRLVMDESFTTPELFDLAVAYVRYVWLHAGVDTAPIPVCGVARGPGPLAAMSGCVNP